MFSGKGRGAYAEESLMSEGSRLRAVVEGLEGRVLLSGSIAGSAAWVVHHYGNAMVASTARTASPLARQAVVIAQPDLLLRDYQFPTPASYNGDNVYSTDGGSESLSQSTHFFPQIYQLAVQNDGNVADSFTISGGGGTKTGWRVSYFDSQVQGGLGGNPISAAVEAGTYRTPVLQPGEMFEFRVEVGPASFNPGGSIRQVNITATSVANPSKVDVISTFTTGETVRGVQIRRRNFDSSGLYQINLENTGNNKDRFRVFGEAGGSGWTARYYSAFQGGADVTSQVTNGGWITDRVTYGNTIPLLVKITTTDGQVHTDQVIAQSFNDGSKSDITEISTAPAQPRPNFFPIGVFSQPAYSFDGWKGLGVNTMFFYESQGGTVSMASWDQAAANAGLKIIRQPSANPSDDIGKSNLLAWVLRRRARRPRPQRLHHRRPDGPAVPATEIDQPEPPDPRQFRRLRRRAMADRCLRRTVQNLCHGHRLGFAGDVPDQRLGEARRPEHPRQGGRLPPELVRRKDAMGDPGKLAADGVVHAEGHARPPPPTSSALRCGIRSSTARRGSCTSRSSSAPASATTTRNPTWQPK